MKGSAVFTLVLVLIGSMAFAKSDPAYSVKPRPLNLQEVANSIKYPTVTKAHGVEGTVIVAVNIDADGKVSSKIVLTYPCSQLKKEVEKAVDNLKFEPARNSAGEPVASTVRIPFSFELTID